MAIFQFVLCKHTDTEALRTTLIPLNSTTPTSVTATCWLQTMNPRDLFHADCQVGAWDFFSGKNIALRVGKLVLREGSQQHYLPAQKGLFHMSKLIGILDILFQTRVKMYSASIGHCCIPQR